MTRRWAAAALLALGLARVAHADDAQPADAAAASVAEAPPAPVEPPAVRMPPRVLAPAPVVEPLVAAPPPAARGDVAPVAGALTAVVPFIAGAALWSVDDDRQLQNIGTYIMATGFAAAPWVAHGLHRRWKRALAYGSVSAGLSAATL